MRISLIAAASDNDVIGRDNDLPWHLPDDFRHFKRTTKGHHVIMGRRTWESQGQKPLPHRTNIVVSSRRDYETPGAILVHSLDEGLERARAANEDEVFVIGGTRLYAEALGVADRIYLTRVHTKLEGDAHFPRYDPAQWRELSRDVHEADPRHAHAFTILTLERR
ncbi:dihydrofolate reductase [Enhygromyxa salina]|uniref:Dihydrofolate reductase n=1 Tax=Enhygromyxa salina TaxID=215803 RepID=A0A2S9YYR7_9BACT|nr:dihydrofolate reductase [Enhygromyxa salina]PRQ10233.1 Dihydrofolate reductase type 3 [Enhygromyxa salina]